MDLVEMETLALLGKTEMLILSGICLRHKRRKLTLSSMGWIIDVDPVINFPFPSLGDLGDWNNGFNGTTGGPPWTFWLEFSTVVMRGLRRLLDCGTCPTADWSDFAWLTKYIHVFGSSINETNLEYSYCQLDMLAYKMNLILVSRYSPVSFGATR